jgi:hypothetical protein
MRLLRAMLIAGSRCCRPGRRQAIARMSHCSGPAKLRLWRRCKRKYRRP